MRGTSHIAICEVASMGREITVRNVVWGNCAARPEGSPHRAAATERDPPVPTSLHDFPMAGLLVALATNDLQSNQSGNRSSDCIFCKIKLYR